MESTSVNTYKRAFSANENIKDAAESYKNKTPTQIAKIVIGILTLGIGYGIMCLVEKLTIRDPKVREFCDNAIKIHDDLSTAVVNFLDEAKVNLGNNCESITFKEGKDDNGHPVVTISHGKHEAKIEGSLESIVRKIESDFEKSRGVYNLKNGYTPLDKKKEELNIKEDPDVEQVNIDASKQIGFGSRGCVFTDTNNSNVIKTFNESELSEIKHEMKMFNRWASIFKTGEKCKLVDVNGSHGLMMPYRCGKTPTTEEVTGAVKTLFHAGIMMADPAPGNFIKLDDGRVLPIDFGLMFEKNEKYNNHFSKALAESIVQDYVKGGHVFIDKNIKKEYGEHILKVDDTCKKTDFMNSQDLVYAELNEAVLPKGHMWL